MIYQKKAGVPQFECTEYAEKTKDYVVLIPIINEGDRIIKELKRAYDADIADYADIVICDGGSTDGCTDEKMLKKLQVNTLLVKQDAGKQGAQLRMGIWWALERGYQSNGSSACVSLYHIDLVRRMENPKLRLHSTICWSLKSLETLR